MYKPSFENQSKKAEAPSDLKALFKINAGLYELQKSKQQSQGAPVGTVAEQIQKQGLEAISEPTPPEEAVEQSGVMQAVPDTAMGKTAMQAGLGAQITAAEQAKQQQAAMQAAMQMAASQQAPQPMARGGIASLTAKNMKNFQRGGVVGFNGEGESAVKKEEKKESPWYESFPEGALIRKIGKGLAASNKYIEEYDKPADMSSIYSQPGIPSLEMMPLPEKPTLEGKTQQPAASLLKPESAAQGAAAPRPGKGLAALASTEKDEIEAEKQAALKAIQEQQMPVVKTPQQLRAEREAEAKATGVDLYGQGAKERTAALEKEFANQEAARAEANKSRGMDNLITMLTSSGGAPSLFSGLAKGTQAYQAAEKLQKADDIIWGGKRLQFMEKLNEQKDLLNERNKALMLGDIAESQRLSEAMRLNSNELKKQTADVYSKSMNNKNQAFISDATNKTNMAIAQLRANADAENRKVAKEAQDYNAMQARILENARLHSTINKMADEAFQKLYPIDTAIDQVPGGAKRSPEAQAKWDKIKEEHNNKKNEELQRYEKQNYEISYRQWVKFGKDLNLPEPINPVTEKPAQASGKTRPGYFVRDREN